MNIRILVLSLACAIEMTVVADQRVSFVRQLQGNLNSAFSCDCYSVHREGPWKMFWYPSAACRIDSPYNTARLALFPEERVVEIGTVDAISNPIYWRKCRNECCLRRMCGSCF